MSQATDTGKLTENVTTLFSKAVQGNLQLFNRFSGLATDALKHFSAGASGGKLPSPGETLTRLVDLNLAYWSALADHSLGFANDVAAATERALGVHSRNTPSAPRSSPVPIILTAYAGKQAVAAFQIENTFSNPLDVSFRAGDLVSPQGVHLKIKPVTFTPARLTLASKSQAVVQAAIDVPVECQPGITYTVAVEPVGFPMKEISIRLNVMAPANEPESKAAGRPKAKHAKSSG
jgi:hypothetical protein